jgi:hypothetical protein
MSRSIFNIHVTHANPKNVFNAATYNPGNIGSTTTTTHLSVEITPNQVNVLQTIYDQYVTLLADRTYEKIPSNYQAYITLLNQVKAINVQDYKLQTLIYIVENGLVGSMNASNLYQRFAYDEIKVGLLNKRIREILSDKNVKETISSTSGQFSATKTIKLSPIFSYYIYLYGMPAFGVGFDPAKLAFIKSLPFFNTDILDVDLPCSMRPLVGMDSSNNHIV